MAFERYAKPLPFRKGPYWDINVEADYAKIDQHGIRLTVPINRLAKVANEGRPKMKVTSDSRINMETNHGPKASMKKKKLLRRRESRRTRKSTYRSVLHLSMVWLLISGRHSQASRTYYLPFREPYWRRLRNSPHKPKYTRRKRRLTRKRVALKNTARKIKIPRSASTKTLCRWSRLSRHKQSA